MCQGRENWVPTGLIKNLNTSINFSSFPTILLVSSNPETILLPKYRYSSPKHWAAPTPSAKSKPIVVNEFTPTTSTEAEKRKSIRCLL